jgi:hypothetical protein
VRQPVLSDGAVEVVASEGRVAGRGEHLKAVRTRAALDRRHDVEDRHIECAATEVVHGDPLGAGRLADSIGEARCGGLVHDAHSLEVRKPRSVARRLALRVVEVGGHRDHGPTHGNTELRFRDAAELPQDLRGDLLRRDEPPVDRERRHAARTLDERGRRAAGECGGFNGRAPHQALGARHGLRGVCQAPTPRRSADDRRPAGEKAHDRGHDGPVRAPAENARSRREAVGNQRVGGAEVDPDDRIASERLGTAPRGKSGGRHGGRW